MNRSLRRLFTDIFLITSVGFVIVVLNYKQGIASQNTDAQSWYIAFNDLYVSLWKDRPLYVWFVQSAVRSFPSFSILENCILVNCMLLFMISMVLYFSMIRLHLNRLLVLGGVILFQCNHVTLTWVYQPLPQLFDYLVGALVFLNLTCWTMAKDGKPQLLSLFSLIVFAVSLSLLAVCSLAKTYFYLSIFSVFIGIFYKRFISGVFLGVILLTPYYGWYLYFTKKLGLKWYSHSMDSNFKQGTWFLEALQEANWDKIGTNIFLVQQSLGSVINCFPTVVVLSLVIFYGYVYLQGKSILAFSLDDKHVERRRFSIPVKVFLSSFFAFGIFSYALQGYIPPRIAFVGFPIWLPLLWQYNLDLAFSVTNSKAKTIATAICILFLQVVYNYIWFRSLVMG